MPKYHNRQRVTVTVEPAQLVSTVAAKDYIRAPSGTDDDILIATMIKAATKYAEEYTGRGFVTQTVKLTMDGFGGHYIDSLLGDGIYDLPYTILDGVERIIRLPKAPIQSVTSITTYATDNTSSVFSSSSYTVDDGDGAIVFLNEGSTWPVGLRERAAVEVLYVCGYGETSDVPDAIIQAVLSHVSAMYNARSFCAMPELCKALLNPFRIVKWVGV